MSANWEERIKIFQDTISWCETDPVLRESIEQGLKNTEIFYEDHYPVFDAFRFSIVF
ncbi:MAG: hypothetical protein HUJ72_04925 [Blautia sp.]|nr:hypothetical protein [Blautia sp.]